MEQMSGKERMMTAFRNKQPDRVPAAPDISIMIPTKLTGKPTWEVEYLKSPSLQKAYIDAVRYFGMDGWMYNGNLSYKSKSAVGYDSQIVKKETDKWYVQTRVRTPDGDMTYTYVYPRDNPSTLVEFPVKDFRKDFKKIRHLFSEIVSYDPTLYRQAKEEIKDLGIICCGIWPPGLQNMVDLMGLEDLTYAYYDNEDLFEELTQMCDKRCVRMTEMAIEEGVESVLTGGSGSITLQSPELFRKLSFPTIQKITKMCRQAGIISGIHSCGKERYIVELCANGSDLDYINPLEVPPMGDCDLADCKNRFGDKLALMGNLHTSEVMLFGSVELVRLKSLEAILAAGRNGGFVLSTGDQCGRDTPAENIFEMVSVCKEYGMYPLDTEKIETEIKRLKDGI